MKRKKKKKKEQKMQKEYCVGKVDKRSIKMAKKKEKKIS
jgi:hypothetical protein